ncbi:DUF4178 domain-containing protein [Thioflexithrix psekupsensis]|uniref:DUF4178 domain-containing protein n=1 Tax=Thioflexithrix psekupsensis TaxID=1570016 RepID=A0A251X5A0_9GAMM|nr:DUF4178 domain-containing protein [Thioflexithrix psekupsensis]OUD12535.1 hypothetical protein TPSD3_15725 [Thioflexithrix psekupsensis]
MANFTTFQHQCPACGAPIEWHSKEIKVVTCSHCNNGLFLEDEQVKNLGIQSTLVQYPSLLKLFHLFHYQSDAMMPIGQVRFDYGRGFWDEWWVVNQKTKKSYWLSVDEGDYALEQPLNVAAFPPAKKGVAAVRHALHLNRKLQLQHDNGQEETVQVSEMGEGVCIGFVGELPELIHLGDRFQYAHLSGSEQRLYTIEISNDVIRLFQGIWIDPFLIKVQHHD